MLHAADRPLRRARVDPPLLLGLLTVLLQICYPLADGRLQDRLTVITVLTFSAASIAHLAGTRPPAVAARIVLACMLTGFLAELLAVHTGFPFGHYTYAPALGVQAGGVPLVIGLAWAMMAWPAAVVARRIVSSFPARVAVGAWALASWDLFLDPQMVAAGRWSWTSSATHLPGVSGIPLSNYAGWLLVSGVISLLVQSFLREDRAVRSDRWAVGMYLWTYASSVIALAVFLGHPAAAAWGAAAMGLVAVPLVAGLLRR